MSPDHPPGGSSPQGARSEGSSPRATTIPEAGAPESITSPISCDIAQIYFRAFGHGAERTRTFVQPQFAVCVLRDIFTAAERTLIADGGADGVEATRIALNDALDEQYVAVIEEHTGQQVQSHLARIRVPADVAVHFFFLAQTP